jgi:membrane protease YdiL (CAAX protease family)
MLAGEEVSRVDEHGRPRRFSILVYLEESRRPGVALGFILPILIAYEMGVQVMNLGRQQYIINAADRYIKVALGELGFFGPMLSALTIVLTLLFMHAHRQLPWRLHRPTLPLMLLESVVVSLPLFALKEAVWYVMLATELPGESLAERLILSLGAGIYEEFLFRLLLLGGLLQLGRWLAARCRRAREPSGGAAVAAQVLAVVVSAGLFALIHHLGPHGEPFRLRFFAFRMVAGVYFAYLCLARGLGIAVGAHTAYDVMLLLQTSLLTE